MKAIVYTEYGSPDVLQLKDIEKPSPADNEILVKIHATPINYGDLMVRNLKNFTHREFNMPAILLIPTRFSFGLNKPKNTILGAEFAGEVEAVGKGVTRFKVGDEVLGYRGMDMKSYAEYICVAEDSNVILKPTNMSYPEASAIPYGAITAYSLLQKVNIQAGQKVLINGASGSIGSIALQIAKHLGAEVTAVCGTKRVEMVKAMGADKVIDYTQEDFTKGTEKYDLIFDVLGRSSFSDCKHVLNPNGILLYASFKMKQVWQMLWTSKFSDKKVICAISTDNLDDLIAVKEMAQAGAVKTIIDRCYPLEQTADAHRYAESKQYTGRIIITVA